MTAKCIRPVKNSFTSCTFFNFLRQRFQNNNDLAAEILMLKVDLEVDDVMPGSDLVHVGQDGEVEVRVDSSGHNEINSRDYGISFMCIWNLGERRLFSSQAKMAALA